MSHAVLKLAALALLFSAQTAIAQQPKVKEDKPGQLAKAKVGAAQALATAQAAVPKGKLVSSEIEEEDGALVYAFSFKTTGKTGEDEVLIDAVSGKLLKTEHETPESEAKEKAADKAGQKAVEKAAKKKPAATEHTP